MNADIRYRYRMRRTRSGTRTSEPCRFNNVRADPLGNEIGKPVRLVDGGMLSWYGSRAVQGLRYLRRLAMPV